MRVIVGVSGSPSNLAALRHAVAEARRADALLIPMLAWSPPGVACAYGRFPDPHLLRAWQKLARKRLDTAFDEAFGGYPLDLQIQTVVTRAAAETALVELACNPGDLLVIGTGCQGRLRRLFPLSVSRYCLAHAKCPVIAVPPPELVHEMRLTARAFRKLHIPDVYNWWTTY